MELVCTEGSRLVRSYPDPVFVKDDRVLQNLMRMEEHYTVPAQFMDTQQDVKPYMRKIVTQWMFEVCEEQRCEEEVFTLAVNFLDRFLASTVEVKRNRLQLAATSCMFIASKLKETYPLAADKLVIYTDHSITTKELLDWEMLILSKLRWDVSSVTALDFLDILLDRLNLPAETSIHVRKHALACISVSCLGLPDWSVSLLYNVLVPTKAIFLQNFAVLTFYARMVSLAKATQDQLDEKCAIYPPSMLACACIAVAIENATSKWRSTLYTRILHDITNLDLDCLRSCQEHINQLTKTENPSNNKDISSHPGTPTESLEVVPIH